MRNTKRNISEGYGNRKIEQLGAAFVEHLANLRLFELEAVINAAKNLNEENGSWSAFLLKEQIIKHCEELILEKKRDRKLNDIVNKRLREAI